jgi:phage portal protein BeeE
MGFIDKITKPFQKKNFIAPLGTQKPMMVIMNGQKYFFEKLNNEKDASEYLIKKYNTLNEVAAPINKMAEFGSVVEPELYDANDEYIEETSPLYKAILSPNKYQNWQEFYKKHLIYRILLGQSYVNSYGYTSPNLAFELKLLPPQYTTIHLKNKYDFRNLEIEYYEVKMNGFNDLKITDIETVMHVKNTSPNFGTEADLYGYSKLLGCVHNIESIEAGYQAKVGLYKHGPRVIITGKSQGEFASANLQSNEDVQQLQNRINTEYGLQTNQFSVMITDIPLDVSTVSMDMGQLKINENNIADFQSICRALDIDSRVLSDVSSSTFSNVEMAFDSFLNGSFKILIENDYAQWSQWLSILYKQKLTLKPNFENIPAIVKKQNEGNDKIILMAKDGLLTRNEALIRINEEPVSNPEFDEYFAYNTQNAAWKPVLVEQETMEGPSPEQMTAQANLRGSVGGVQGILSIQASVSQGLTGYDSGVAILTEIYGFSPETARQVLGKPIIHDTSQNDENINNTQDGTDQADENIQEPNQ